MANIPAMTRLAILSVFISHSFCNYTGHTLPGTIIESHDHISDGVMAAAPGEENEGIALGIEWCLECDVEKLSNAGAIAKAAVPS